MHSEIWNQFAAGWKEARSVVEVTPFMVFGQVSWYSIFLAPETH